MVLSGNHIPWSLRIKMSGMQLHQSFKCSWHYWLLSINRCLWRLLYCLLASFVEVLDAYYGARERKSEYENSEDERRRSKIGSLKKKAINASNKFTHSLRKRGKRKVDYRVPSVPIEDIRDPREESAVCELRQKLLDRDLLPAGHDDYHTLLRWVFSCFVLFFGEKPSFSGKGFFCCQIAPKFVICKLLICILLSHCITWCLRQMLINCNLQIY